MVLLPLVLLLTLPLGSVCLDCGAGEFSCGEVKCIGAAAVCDGKQDCGDGSDEFGCKCREKHMVPCLTGDECISKAFLCDGDFDCKDKSDENDCKNNNNTVNNCQAREFRCKAGTCIMDNWVCDNVKDCPDGDDESDDLCENDNKNNICSEIQFQCDDKCIPERWVCDGRVDCTDGKDEAKCMTDEQVVNCNATLGQFLCDDNSDCLKDNKVCDGTADCRDGSDEFASCHTSCQHKTCQQKCLKTPEGGVCFCQDGYQLDSESGLCQDIDECQNYGTCDQKCSNVGGSFVCSCHEGYTMVNGECKATGQKATLFFSTRDEIRGLEFSGNHSNFFLVASHISDKRHSVGVSYDHLKERVLWTAIRKGQEGIMFAKLEGEGDNEIGEYLVNESDQVTTPEDLSIDYLGRNVYFTDSHHKFVGVASLDEKNVWTKVVIGLEKPRAIAVYPEKGIMFFSDWGELNPSIIRTAMDGSSFTRIVSTNTVWPNGVAIDKALDRVYWSDARHNILETAKFDGSDRRTILDQIVQHPFSIAVFENTVYWSDWERREILSCNKFTGKDVKTLVKEFHLSPMGLSVFHPNLESDKVTNPCHNHPCSHMCLLTDKKGFTCECPIGLKMSSDGFKCLGESKARTFDIVPIAPKETTETVTTRVTTTVATTAKTKTTTSKQVFAVTESLDDVKEEMRKKKKEGINDYIEAMEDLAKKEEEEGDVEDAEKIRRMEDKLKDFYEHEENSDESNDVTVKPVASSSSSKSSLLIGMVILCVLLVLLVVVVAGYLYRRQHAKSGSDRVFFSLRHPNLTSRTHERLGNEGSTRDINGDEELKDVVVGGAKRYGSEQDLKSTPLHLEWTLKRSTTSPHQDLSQSVESDLAGSTPTDEEEFIDFDTKDTAKLIL